MRCYHKILCISYKDHVTIEEVCAKIKNKYFKILMQLIKKERKKEKETEREKEEERMCMCVCVCVCVCERERERERELKIANIKVLP